ncbi:MAG: hypothetical protein EAZ37_02525 [Burkholderiales bacterium]|nr:MAG: hypothetical protein EAZ37_02525 [Burkholderiales bacterium]
MGRRSHWIFVLLALVFSVGLVFWVDFQGFDAKPASFDENHWKIGREQIKQNGDPGCVLGGMANQLRKNNLLTLMPRRELVALLGLPDRTESKDLFWEIGQCHGRGWKNSQLRIELDTNGRAKDVHIQESKQ